MLRRNLRREIPNETQKNMIITWQPEQWKSELSKPLAQRLGPATDELIDHVQQINAATGISTVPEAVVVAGPLLEDVQLALTELPPGIQRRLDAPLLGVRFARGLGSSGLTEVIADASGDFIGLVSLLDVDIMANHTANTWASWKETTPFDIDETLTITARLELHEHDNRKNAIQYILLHEFGHVLTANSGLLPNWWLNPRSYQSVESYAFLQLSWVFAEDKQILALPAEEFELRRRVAFYNGNKLSAATVEPAYVALRATRFATLYGACNAYDDFAEAFASYVHTEIMGRPYEIEIHQAGNLLLKTDNFWTSERAAAKRAVLAAFLAD